MLEVVPGRDWLLKLCRFEWGFDVMLGPLLIRLQRPT
jgi:hypothetical protein